MIARYLIFFLSTILIPDIYLYRRFRRQNMPLGKWTFRALWFLPTIFLLLYTGFLFVQPDFEPADPAWLHRFLFLFCFLAVPKAIVALFSVVSRLVARRWKKGKRPVLFFGCLVAAFAVYALIYGSTIGFEKLEINRITLRHPDLPEAFRGYKIVLFSDAHVGSYRGSRQYILANAIEAINQQHPDAIVFTGDLQNQQPSELTEHSHLLSSLRAKDGIYSVLGNHDYADYIDADSATAAANIAKMAAMQKDFGWTLLNDSHHTIRRGNDSLVIAGMQDEGEKEPFVRGDIGKTMKNIGPKTFVVLLQHDPTAWRRTILPRSHAQLTLSGHTHGGQFALFGLSPGSFHFSEIAGLYEDNHRFLYVTKGLGGLIPFRFGATPEIVVITLEPQRLAQPKENMYH